MAVSTQAGKGAPKSPSGGEEVSRPDNEEALHRIVIIGGGAAGFELAIRLGRSLGRKERARITLVDENLTHLWKPLLHEVAAGTLDSPTDAVEFLPQARAHHFRFRLGRLRALDPERKQVELSGITDASGVELAPSQVVAYDTLVIAVGCTVSDFGVPGVNEHCMLLDNQEQAERFHKRFLASHIRAQAEEGPLDEADLNVGIVGAGATGVELAAELHKAARQIASYGFDRISPERDVKLALVETADRVLPALPERVSQATERQLRELGIQLHVGEQVTEVAAEGLHTKSGSFVPCRMKVWAAGVMAPDFLSGLGGLETNKRNQIVVRRTLQTRGHDDIFALGDCAECPWPGHDTPVPPRAQAAHQQARVLARSLTRRVEGKPPLDFEFKDRGSLISLSGYTTVGSMSGTIFGDIKFEGLLARLAYRSLYRSHQKTIYGLPRTILMTLADWFRRGAESSPKLH